MNILVAKTPADAEQIAYTLIKERLAGKREFVLGLATGSTPVGMYKMFKQDQLDCRHVTSVNLDEYIGLAPSHPQSYNHFMEERLFNDVPFKESHLPRGDAKDPDAEAERYEQLVRSIGVDLQLLGIGENGHIAFNEPGTALDAKTHVTALTESTREANRRFFDANEEVPTHAITMGLDTIMNAREIVLVATGDRKANAVHHMIESVPSVDWPATILQAHPSVTIVLDTEAASQCAQALQARGSEAAARFFSIRS
ncbi:glucosamine-6-phosphate deaminase [Exiguobacterium sp. SH0S7]|uniref:glucosamine-6-phosphate deaminase n=1 Tax=Exiguobacterium sp. SH0S7 TaxID=2510951 RepID=UPI00103B4F99|nr:glucosamine-6-phosphate deaminase [Exiguobacterium sp. SH0S7]TCI69271.1 glucosamine-6-phosphate deaminase [Exiguobacterium sp. SH0S7]